MIHIIGTSHYLQVWTDAKRNGESLDASNRDIEQFASYLKNAAKSLNVDMIAEEASDEWISNYGHGASSVAKGVTDQLRIQHLFCDPNRDQRRSMGLMVGREMLDYSMMVSSETGQEITDVHSAEVRNGFEPRETFWLSKLLASCQSDTSVIFVCGADHVDTFKARLDEKGVIACIHCRDFTVERCHKES